MNLRGIQTPIGQFDYEASPEFLQSIYKKAQDLAEKWNIPIGDVLKKLPPEVRPPQEVIKQVEHSTFNKSTLYILGGGAVLLLILALKK